ncbi:MAG: ArsB/NhaD family transporter [Candidatus Omnitrophota bacterium]
MINSMVALIIFLVTLYFVITEKVDKVIAVLCGALLMIISGLALGFYSQKQALMAIDFNTLGLLAGMMIIVSILRKTGFFTYIAISIAKFSRGKPWILMILLGVSTGFISMLVDNVTTILIVGPVSILVCDILGITPLPILMAEILLSNVGGVGTLIGDPPNILIGSASGLSFNDFLKHLFPVTVAVMAIVTFVLRILYKKNLSEKPRNFQAVLKIDARRAIKDRRGMVKCLLALGITFTLFFLHDRLGLYPSFIALIGAGLAFLLLRPDPEEIFHDIEWPVLAFFACFFVIVGGLDNTGVLSKLAKQTVGLARVDIKLYKILLLWVSGILTSLVGSVPFPMVMIPVVQKLIALGVDGNSLWWILALGVGFGCNSLPIGSAAGILGVSMSRKSRSPISTKTWFFSGTIVSVVSLIFVTLLILADIF